MEHEINLPNVFFSFWLNWPDLLHLFSQISYWKLVFLIEKQLLHWDWTFNNVRELRNCYFLSHRLFISLATKVPVISWNIKFIFSSCNSPCSEIEKQNYPLLKLKWLFTSPFLSSPIHFTLIGPFTSTLAQFLCLHLIICYFPFRQ